MNYTLVVRHELAIGGAVHGSYVTTQTHRDSTESRNMFEVRAGAQSYGDTVNICGYIYGTEYYVGSAQK